MHEICQKDHNDATIQNHLENGIGYAMLPKYSCAMLIHNNVFSDVVYGRLEMPILVTEA